MRYRNFKTLMLYGEYVDVSLLEKGIYFCKKPYLYLENETIESIIETTKDVIKATGVEIFTENYFDNLRQCLLVSIHITIN